MPTIRGKGAARKKIAKKAAAASKRLAVDLSALPPIRTTACKTMASTAAFKPKNSASTGPTLP